VTAAPIKIGDAVMYESRTAVDRGRLRGARVVAVQRGFATIDAGGRILTVPLQQLARDSRAAL
jgi:hypothetical protein